MLNQTVAMVGDSTAFIGPLLSSLDSHEELVLRHLRRVGT